MDTPTAVTDALANAPAIIVPLVREIPPERRKLRLRAGKWSAHEHACHLADVHALFEARLDLMLEEDRPRIVPFAPGPPGEDDCLLAVDLEEALESFVTKRAEIVARLRTLSPPEWERAAEHPEYSRYSVAIMARHFALHDLFHAYRIEEILLARGP